MQIFEQQNAVKMHFFDYSLWNHYVNVLSHYYRWHDFFACLLLCLRLGHLSYLLSYFCFGTFGTLGTFSIPLIHPKHGNDTDSTRNRVGVMSLYCP